MKTIKKILLIFFILTIFFAQKSFASHEIINEQMESLNISSLILQGEKYTKEVFPDIDLSNLLNNAIVGNIDNR